MKYLLYFFGLLLVFSCKGQKESNMNNIPNIPLEKQITYFIDLSIKYPFELYINDIRARNGHASNAVVEINPYVLKNGKYKIKLKLFPNRGDTKLTPKDIEDNTISLGKYIMNRETEDILSFDTYQKLPLPKIDSDVPFVDTEWEVELTELPYELEGWSKGQDLSKMDKQTLENKVVKHYEKLKTILNNGNVEEWMKLTHKRLEETWVFDYTKDKENIYEGNKNAVVNEYKNNMLPLEDYKMKIYGDGKLVTLERNATKEFQGYEKNIKGWNALISNDGGLITNIPVKLYLPEGSDEFVIIRK